MRSIHRSSLQRFVSLVNYQVHWSKRSQHSHREARSRSDMRNNPFSTNCKQHFEIFLIVLNNKVQPLPKPETSGNLHSFWKLALSTYQAPVHKSNMSLGMNFWDKVIVQTVQAKVLTCKKCPLGQMQDFFSQCRVKSRAKHLRSLPPVSLARPTWIFGTECWKPIFWVPSRT